MTTLTALRAVQLVAGQLDAELVKGLSKQVEAALSIIPSFRVSRIAPELQAAVHGLVYWLSVLRNNASYGQQLHNLQYEWHAVAGQPPSRIRKIFHFFTIIILPWAWSRLNEQAIEEGWRQLNGDVRQKVYRIMMRFEKMAAIARYLNHVAFLFYGKYMSLADRTCGMLLVTKKEQEGAPMSYEYLSRELLWHGFSEFAVFVLPYLDFRWLFAQVTRRLRQAPPPSTEDAAAGDSKPVGTDKNNNGGVALAGPTVDVEACALCNQSPPWSSHRSKCGHTFCYYCASTAVLQNSSAECPLCYEVLTLAGLSRVGVT